MINQEIATIFDRMASYIDMSDSPNAFFKSRAFRKASEIIDSLPIDLDDKKFIESPQLLIAMEGIGKAIAAHIVEYLKTGKIEDYEKMKKESPVDLEELLNIQGLGPKKILKLYKLLGVTNIETLKEASESGKIAQLDGFGEKSQQNILESLSFAILNKDRRPYIEVEKIVDAYLEYLDLDKSIIQIQPLGSFRRKKDMIGDIDFLVSSKDPEKSMKHFIDYPKVDKILANGETKSSVWLKDKIQADIRIVEDDSFGSAMQYFTGNKDHNVKLRNIAIDKGYKLSEYGLFDRKTDELIESKSEERIYKILKLQFPIPELRENRGEVELALRNKLPNVISAEDIHGDLHMHTTFSDGANSAVEMATYAKSLGYKYIAITDHIGKLYVANAIQADRFDDYLESIEQARQKVSGIKIFLGAEVEIDKFGDYEFDENLLSKLDIVIAGVHMSNKMSSDDMTKRLEKVIKNPLTTFIAHPTGRILNQRPGYTYDFEYIFKLCADYEVALEINSHPYRLDLSDELVKLAITKNCKIAINTDAHSQLELNNIKYGIYTARRGWVTSKDLYTPI